MDWTETGGHLERVFEFADFAEAFAFMTRVGLIAQERGHHADMAISWNKVTVTLTTHDQGSTVTEADRALAEIIGGLT